jgi:hypothetical protein
MPYQLQEREKMKYLRICLLLAMPPFAMALMAQEIESDRIYVA